MIKMLRSALLLLLALTLVTGVAYPLLVTGAAQLAMPGRASGSLVVRDGRAVGSALLGQSFSDAGHFWGRPSATTPQPYNGASSSGSNLSPTNPALRDAIALRVKALRDADPGNAAPVPVDLVTASGSGLDPHISPAAAFYQVGRVARARGMDAARLRALVESHIEGRTFGLLGEPRVNVLLLNLALDAGRG
ncbi:MAG TPA: potassium-transporting ATPase subunit KdpC [Steroidobacteraceae bacterium]|nr:potassium-transporting ATPase subunit KdpC [Steroidobacteraceae bacterium]